jgi:NitT/TauT family transport system permease protein
MAGSVSVGPEPARPAGGAGIPTGAGRPAPVPPAGLLLGRRRRDGVSLAIVRLGLLVSLLAAWEVGYRRGLIDPFFFSAPSLVGTVIYELFAGGTIWRHLLVTVQEAVLGLAIGFAAGAVMGFLAAQGGLFGQLVEPAMLLLNSVPRIVLAPLFIMWFGIGIWSKVALSFFLVFVVIFFAVYAGLREVDRSLVERIVVMGGSRADLLREVYVPSVLVWVFSSLRVTVGFAFTGAVVGEFIASSRGLGYLLNFAQNSFNSSLMLATVAIIMVVIALLFVGLAGVERRAMIWKQDGR